MQDLLQQFREFNGSTKAEILKSWATKFERQIGNISQSEKGYYYLLLSQLNAIYLRNLEEAKSIIKKIRNPSPSLLQQIKLRRCFYKFLEGDYENASQTLEQIIKSRSSCNQKIAKDFFSRILAKDNYSSFGKNNLKVNRSQSYETDYLKAIQQERKGKFKMASEIHKEIVENYGDLDEVIKYQSAKHVVLLVAKEGGRPSRQEMQKYMNIVLQYQKKLANNKYYSQKLDYLLRVLDFIQSQNEEQEQLRKYQLAKEFIIDQLKQAISVEQDSQTLQKLKSVLNALKESKASGEQVCYKFLGDKQLIQLSNFQDKKGKNKAKQVITKVAPTDIFSDQQQENMRSKFKKTAKKSKINQQAENENQSYKLKSKINTQSNISKINQNYYQQEQPIMKSNLKSQNNQQTISKFSKPPQDQFVKKKSKFVKNQQIIQPNRQQDQQIETYNLKSRSKLVSSSGGQDIKQTYSKNTENFNLNPDFKGSSMTKINFNSGGHDDRYFYMKDDFLESMKLFYSSKKQKKSPSDEFYRLKGLKSMTVGKKSDALKRSECQDFTADLCFTLYVSSAEEDYERNFYVKEEKDFNEWINIFKYLLSKKESPENMRAKTKILMK